MKKLDLNTIDHEEKLEFDEIMDVYGAWIEFTDFHKQHTHLIVELQTGIGCEKLGRYFLGQHKNGEHSIIRTKRK